MEIKKFQLNNMGRFSKIDVQLAPISNEGGPPHLQTLAQENERHTNTTVFIGNNGAGKTSLLKALATSLSWFVARVRNEKGSGSPILEDDIKNEASSASIVITVNYEYKDEGKIVTQNAEWKLAKTRKGRKSDEQSFLSMATHIANEYRENLTNDSQASLPLIVFYPVERVVLDIPLKIRGKHSFQQIDGYENALNQGVDFRRFFEWFREREDTENEQVSELMNDHLLDTLLSGENIKQKVAQWKAETRDQQLSAVRDAISAFMPDFTNLRIRRKPRLHISVDKKGETLNVSQLSQGEKSLIALVGDIARRLAMMNPALDNPLEGDGIVLIDEVELHLHPRWQRTVIQRLSNTFPNCQFVLTTHSPLVISDAKDVLCYSLDDGELTVLDDFYGLDANQVLLRAMNTDIRNADVNRRLNDLMDKIQEGHVTEAKDLLGELKEELPANIELTKAQLLIHKLELRHAKN